jgi:phytol kinase
LHQNLIYYLAYAILYGIILLMGEGMYRYFHLPEGLTRNFSHLSAGLVSLAYPWVFTSHWWVLFLAVQSAAVLLLTRSAGWFQSHHKSARISWGSPLFFASLYGCFLAYTLTRDILYFLLPLLILTFSDMLASMMGRNLGKVPPDPWQRWMARGKTLQGSAAFLGSALCISVLMFTLKGEWNLGRSVLAGTGVALLTTLTEALTPRGFDNFFIPAITLITLFLYSHTL